VIRSGTPKELQKRQGQLVWRLSGLLMPRVDRAAAQLADCPWPPDRLRVAVDVEVVASRDEQQHWAPDLAACGAVIFLMCAVDAQADAVVLAHAMDDGRLAEGGAHTSAWFPSPISAGDGVWYQRHGSELMNASVGLSVWPRNHQCYQVRTNASLSGAPNAR
jgi:hypothetical protein